MTWSFLQCWCILDVGQVINVWCWNSRTREQFTGIVIRFVRSRAQTLSLLNTSQNSLYQPLMLTGTSISRLSTDIEMVLTWFEMHVLWQDQAVISCPDQEILGLWVCCHGNSSTIECRKFPWWRGRPLHYALSFYLCRGSLFGEWWLPHWPVPPTVELEHRTHFQRLHGTFSCMGCMEHWAVLESIQYLAASISMSIQFFLWVYQNMHEKGV